MIYVIHMTREKVYLPTTPQVLSGLSMPIEQNESKYSSKHRISTKRLAYWNEPVCKPIIIYTTIFCFALLCFLNLCQATEELIEVLPGGSLNQ